MGMPDYQKIKNICRQNSVISTRLLDEFLLHYAAKHDKLTAELSNQLTKYRHIFHKEDTAWVDGITAQYAGHRIFKKEGLIKKYLKHSALKDLLPEERSYLEQQAATPWRFSFSIIVASPETDFYEMEDVFSEESFLLFSPGIARFLETGYRRLWFNLIGFNGHCWQSFGPINGYKSFEPDDIFFFATELSASIEDEADIINHIEQHPVPYMMLLSGSELPCTVKGNDEIVFALAEYDIAVLPESFVEKQFAFKHAGTVTEYGLKRWNSLPHFAQFYFDKHRHKLLLSAMTDRGFLKLTETLTAMGFPVNPEPDLRLHLTMLHTAEKILRKKIVLNPYSSLFAEKTSPARQQELDKLNETIALMLPDINAGRQPDLQSLARKTGADMETIQEILEHIKKTMRGAPKR